MMPDLLLARHGETDWNREGRLQGRGDSPLTDRGRGQAAALAEFARDFGVRAVLSSPLGRSAATAARVAGAVDCAVEFREELVEIDFGACRGWTLAEVERLHPGFLAERERDKWGCRWPAGESYADVLERLRPLLSEAPLARVTRAPTLLVAHESVNRVLASALCGIPPDQVLASAQPSDVVIRIRPQGPPLHGRIPARPPWSPAWVTGLYRR